MQDVCIPYRGLFKETKLYIYFHQTKISQSHYLINALRHVSTCISLYKLQNFQAQYTLSYIEVDKVEVGVGVAKFITT